MSQSAEVTATLRMIGQEMDNAEVPVHLLVRTLSGLQQIVYLLAASVGNKTIGSRFRISTELQQLYTLKCKIPQLGSYVIPLVLEPSINSQITLFINYETIWEKINYLLLGIFQNNINEIINILPDSKIRNKVLNELRNFIPKAGEGWELGFCSPDSNEVILTDKQNHYIGEWLNIDNREDEIMTVTGELVSIIFDKYKFVIKYPPTNQEIDCFYKEELEVPLMDNRRELIQVTAKYTLNDEGHPTKLTDVTKIEPVDLSPILLKEVSWDNSNLRLKNPIQLTPYMDEESHQLYVVEEPRIGLYVFAYTRENLMDEINEQITMMWEEYAKADSEDLTEDANQLKITLLESIEEV